MMLALPLYLAQTISWYLFETFSVSFCIQIRDEPRRVPSPLPGNWSALPRV
jgi:hypothetical protein